jgi:hypothetical protein
MTANKTQEMVWTVVKVWRGFADGAQVFASKADARRVYSKLHRRCNLDEDDVQIFETRVVRSASKRPRRRSPS